MSVTSSSSPLRSGAARSQGFPRSLVLRGAAVLALSAAAAAGGSALLSGSPADTSGRTVVTVPEIQSVPVAQAASFAILRRPLRAGDAFEVIRAGAGPLGANPALARTVHEATGGLSAGIVSVVPATGGLCLRVPFTHDGGAQWFCQPLAAAREGKLLMALRPAGPLRAGEQLLIGLVPDGVRTVIVTTAAGSPRTVPVRSGVYDVQLSAPRKVSIDLPGGGVRSYHAP